MVEIIKRKRMVSMNVIHDAVLEEEAEKVTNGNVTRMLEILIEESPRFEKKKRLQYFLESTGYLEELMEEE